MTKMPKKKYPIGSLVFHDNVGVGIVTSYVSNRVIRAKFSDGYYAASVKSLTPLDLEYVTECVRTARDLEANKYDESC